MNGDVQSSSCVVRICHFFRSVLCKEFEEHAGIYAVYTQRVDYLSFREDSYTYFSF